MKFRIFTSIAIVSLLLIVLQACEDEGENETKISSSLSSESHKSGENCMNCHVEGGSGEGWFTVAGTLAQNDSNTSFANTVVKLSSGPNATEALEYTIMVDELGNFYTTENINFTFGLYTSVEGELSTNTMVSVISNGECNSCHDNSISNLINP